MRVTRHFRPGAWILGGELVLSLLYFVLPSNVDVQDAIYELFGGGCVVAILWAILRYRPTPRAAWLMFAFANALFVAGDIAFDISPGAGHPSTADYLYLIAYPFLAALPVMLVVASGSHRRVGALVVAAIVTLAFVVFEWVFVTEPSLHHHPLGHRVVVGVLYPVMDSVLLGAFAGFFVSPAWRTPAFGFLVLGAMTQLLGDVATTINGAAYRGGSWINWPWMASYIFWTAAVLHPSMRRLSRRAEAPETRIGRWRLVALAGALLTVPVARVIADTEHKRAGVWVIGVLQAAIALLVVMRMGVILDAVDKIRGRLAQKNEELVEADLLKDEFIALVSHDLRTPLTSIIGYVELALDDEGGVPLDEERRRYIEVVARSSDRLLRLVDDLLLAARLQSGRFLLNVDSCDIESVAAEALDEMNARAQRRSISLVLASDGPVRIECDRRRLLQLLDNLVSNAVKFTPDGGRVEVHVERTLVGAAIEIRDTGVGLEPGDEQRVFDRFYRAPRAVSDQVPGTGLGLFIARAIAERHGGSLVARRRDGGGTILRLELPERAVAAPAEAELVA